MRKKGSNQDVFWYDKGLMIAFEIGLRKKKKKKESGGNKQKTKLTCTSILVRHVCIGCLQWEEKKLSGRKCMFCS